VLTGLAISCLGAVSGVLLKEGQKGREDEEEDISRTGPKHGGAPGRLIIWNSLKPIFLKDFRPQTGPIRFLKARAKIAENFRRNSFARGNLSLLSPYFRLFL
jgi:hypothetical protein